MTIWDSAVISRMVNVFRYLESYFYEAIQRSTEVDHTVMNMNTPKDIKIYEAFKEDNILNAYSSLRDDAQICHNQPLAINDQIKKDVENEWE